MYKCLIIDDEPIAVRVIKNHLASFADFEIVAECSSALEAMPILTKQRIDLIFCDIQMPQITGVDFIRSLNHRPKVIFITAHRDYAIEAFELNVVDYLLKPVSFERFAKAIQNFLELQAMEKSPQHSFEKNDSNHTDYLFLKADKKHYKVNLQEVLYFESMGDYVIAYTIHKKIVTKERISHLAEQLPTGKFLQIHRRFIVAIQKIESVGPGFVEINSKKLSVGRSYKEQLTKLLENGI